MKLGRHSRLTFGGSTNIAAKPAKVIRNQSLAGVVEMLFQICSLLDRIAGAGKTFYRSGAGRAIMLSATADMQLEVISKPY